MPASLYFKDTDGVIKPVPLVDSSSLNVNTLTSVSRPSVHPSGVPFDVPRYQVGSGNLQVYLNGVLCIKGDQYTETTETTITFLFDLQADAEVCAVSTESSDGAVSMQTITSVGRDSTLTAGAPFAVPQHVVASDQIKVYLNGILCMSEEHFREVSSTAITFTSDIPADMVITVTVLTIS